MDEVKDKYTGINQTEKEYTHPYRIYKEGKFYRCSDRYTEAAGIYRETRDKGGNIELRVYSYGKGFEVLSTSIEDRAISYESARDRKRTAVKIVIYEKYTSPSEYSADKYYSDGNCWVDWCSGHRSKIKLVERVKDLIEDHAKNFNREIELEIR